MDRISKEHRSWNMSRIKDRDTKPEIRVRKVLHQMGYRFRLHRKDLPGRPDIVMPRFKTVIFVHGCYWHRHPDCRFAYHPKSRVTFWEKKFNNNVARDRSHLAELMKLSWKAAVIWECETQNRTTLINRIREILMVIPGAGEKS